MRFHSITRAVHVLVVACASLGFSAAAAAELPKKTASGWQVLPDTRLRSVCPPARDDYDFLRHCQKAINLWSGAALDTRRQRLLVFGGGHAGYVGNEVYAVALRERTVERLTEPSRGFKLTEHGLAANPCLDELPDGRPTSRHSYNHLVYIAHVDRLWMFGGSRACRKGSFGRDTWTFDLATREWQKMEPGGVVPPSRVLSGIYDPLERQVLVIASNALYAYEYESNRYRRLAKYKEIPGFYLMTAALDSDTRTILIAGGGKEGVENTIYRIRLDPDAEYPRDAVRTSGATAILGTHAPGFTYLPGTGVFVAWDGAIKAAPGVKQSTNNVYFLDTKTWNWRVRNLPNGPKIRKGDGPYGTYGRFRYVPDIGAVAVVSHVDENVFLLYLSPEDYEHAERH